MVFDDDLNFRELTVEERDILSTNTPMTLIQFGFDEQMKVAKELLFEQALKKTEDAFPGQVFPEQMKPMLYRLAQEYHATIISCMVQPENKGRIIRQALARTGKASSTRKPTKKREFYDR